MNQVPDEPTVPVPPAEPDSLASAAAGEASLPAASGPEGGAAPQDEGARETAAVAPRRGLSRRGMLGLFGAESGLRHARKHVAAYFEHGAPAGDAAATEARARALRRSGLRISTICLRGQRLLYGYVANFVTVRSNRSAAV